MHALLDRIRREHQAAVEGFLGTQGASLVALATRAATALAAGHKLLFCGNGGSACDAMHIAGEFVGRFVADRRALPAIALSADTGMITAIANDYSYADIFARQVEAYGQSGDVLIALSTSGRSPNVLKALEAAQARGLATALFTGEKYHDAPPLPLDHTLVVPSRITAHVQEAHMVALHALASLVEAELGIGATA